MPEATIDLLARIESLEGSEPSREIERTLTDGYARALTLETERLRLERKIDSVEAELVRLRGRLAELRLRSS